ncbi:hypothetical protein NDU88_003553 [Pleurodeles waltl]|uniref:Uncharacterized protein n=1 Tax=Pleurodeles waltl TaxID=8319 RepID=A0AAV7KXS6_PLEWA|nr:hypothetical protein NDU88_003553 [Pleurodeles waltl]
MGVQQELSSCREKNLSSEKPGTQQKKKKIHTRRGKTVIRGEPAHWTKERKPAACNVKQEIEKYWDANAEGEKQEKVTDWNVNLENAGHLKSDIDVWKEERPGPADAMEPKKTAKEWFEAEWWMPPEKPLPPATAQESCG